MYLNRLFRTRVIFILTNFYRRNSSSSEYLTGYPISASDLPSDIINHSLETKILAQKRHSMRYIISDLVVSLIFLSFVGYLISIILRGKVGDIPFSLMIIAIIMFGTIIFIMGKKLISIPLRFLYYHNYNFERTCYAKVNSKYILASTSEDGPPGRDYYVNVQINEDQHIAGIPVSYFQYVRFKNGDDVVVTSFDGYSVQVIKIEDNISKDSFGKSEFSKDNFIKKDFNLDNFNLDDFDIEKFKKENL